MNLLESMPVQTRWGFSRSPHAASLGVELFATRQEAEARLEYWQRCGLRNIWLHEVNEVTTADLRVGVALETTLKPKTSDMIYVLVRVG